MTDNSQSTTKQDWLLFILRWVTLADVMLALLIYKSQNNLTIRDGDFALAFVIGTVANFLPVMTLWARSLQRFHPAALVITDWVIATILISLSEGASAFMVVVTGALILPRLLRLPRIWLAVQVTGIFVITLGILSTGVQPERINHTLSELAAPLLILALLLLIVGALFFHFTQQSQRRRQIEIMEIADTQLEQLNDMNARMQAIYRMASTLSATLDRDQILQAALDVGPLGLKLHERQHLVSMALLLDANDDSLKTVISRGLERIDRGRTVKGAAGLIAQSLEKGIPQIGEDAAKDPELGDFISLADTHSLLCIPLRSSAGNHGVLLYGSDRAQAFTSEHTDLLTAIGAQIAVGLQNVALYRDLLEEKNRLVNIEDDTRKKLARDLHDGPTQNVSAIAMRMSYIQRLIERDPAALPEELKMVEELARGTAREIRHMLFGLRPLALETQGVTVALQQLANKMQETYRQAVAVRSDEGLDAELDSRQQNIMFYLIEEAVNNARKHAEASFISVDMSIQHERLVVQIVDNGVGFDTGAVDANYDQRGSLGMVSMRERAEVLGGTFAIESSEGKGTRITVRIPLKKPSDYDPAKNVTAEFLPAPIDTSAAAT